MRCTHSGGKGLESAPGGSRKAVHLRASLAFSGWVSCLIYTSPSTLAETMAVSCLGQARPSLHYNLLMPPPPVFQRP